jgi:hypothetical protein
MDEVGETIIPTTASSPGAKAAGIGELMDVIVKDCYTEDEQKIFVQGIDLLEKACQKKYSKTFMEITLEERHSLLLDLEKEVNEYNKTKKEEDPTHYYSMMKQLTVWGYFSSEVGTTKALAHVQVPGRWDACIPLKEGQKAWG